MTLFFVVYLLAKVLQKTSRTGETWSVLDRICYWYLPLFPAIPFGEDQPDGTRGSYQRLLCRRTEQETHQVADSRPERSHRSHSAMEHVPGEKIAAKGFV